MTKTLLSIVAAAFGELGFDPPAAVAGNRSRNVLQSLALLNAEGEELADIPGAWPGLRGEQIFNLTPGVEAYDFPVDIAYYREGTGWDRTTHWQVMGPLSDREWQRFRSGLQVSSPYIRYRIMNGQIHFDPVPTTSDTIAFEYVSSNWCVDRNGEPQNSFQHDDDIPLIPDRLFILGLKWRLLAAKRMDYSEERAAYDEAVPRKQARSFVAPPLAINQRGPRYARIGTGIIPDGDWPGR